MAHFTWYIALNVLLLIIGLAVCVLGYWRQRNPGFLLLACSFFVGAVMMTALPAYNRVRQRTWAREHPLAADTDKADSEKLTALTKEYSAPRPVPPASIYLHFPVTGILSVVGLWLLARRQPRRDAEPSTGGDAAPPSASV